MNKQLNVHQKPRNQVEWTKPEMRLLLSFHNKGVTADEVAEIMELDVDRVKTKAFNMGVSLDKRGKNVN